MRLILTGQWEGWGREGEPQVGSWKLWLRSGVVDTARAVDGAADEQSISPEIV